jgi:hypothetical protein
LRTVVFGDRREVRVESRLHELERENDFLRPVDQDQDIAKPCGMLEALEASVEGGYARPQGAIGLFDPDRRLLEVRLGLGHLRRHHVLDVEEIDDGLRLLAALLFDPRQISNPKCFELPHKL